MSQRFERRDVYPWGSYVWSDCLTCGVIYAIPASVYDEQQRTGGYHKCPSGHSQGWAKDECETERLRRERNLLNQRVAERNDEIRHQKALRERAERTASAYKGQVTKLRKRAGRGVCPCCNRSFANLRRHMEAKHPDFVEQPTLEVVEGGKP